LKKIVSVGNLADFPTQRVGESFLDYKYLREFEAKIGTAQNVVGWTYAETIYAKTPENPPHCHVPLSPAFNFYSVPKCQLIPEHNREPNF
jgi:hypothetical protein